MVCWEEKPDYEFCAIENQEMKHRSRILRTGSPGLGPPHETECKVRYRPSSGCKGSVAGISGANICHGCDPERILQPLAESWCRASGVILGGIKRTRLCIDRRVGSVAKPAIRGVHER